MQDYNSLCIAVFICATLVNTQTHRQFVTSYTISSVSELKCTYYSDRGKDTTGELYSQTGNVSQLLMFK